jgi:hypothetical protein
MEEDLLGHRRRSSRSRSEGRLAAGGWISALLEQGVPILPDISFYDDDRDFLRRRLSTLLISASS